MIRHPRMLLPVLLLLTAACDDPLASCGAPRGCEVDGYDLEIIAVRIPAQAGVDAGTGHPVAATTDVVLEYVVRNRGTQTAPARAVHAYGSHVWSTVLDSIPPLEPGDSVVRSVTFPTVQYLTRSDLLLFEVAVTETADAVPANDVRSLNVHVPAGVLEYSIDPVIPGRVRVGEQFGVTYRVRNISTRGRAIGAVLRLCMIDTDLCVAGYGPATFGHVAIPELDPGAVFSLTTVVTLPPTAVVHDEDYMSVLVPCLAPASLDDPYLDPFDASTCGGGDYVPRYIRTLPDYPGVCDAPLLSLDVTHVFTAHNCGRMARSAPEYDRDIDRYLFHVVGIDAEAGRVYRLERSDPAGGLQIFDPDGGDAVLETSPAGSFAFRDAGRYYLVMYSDLPGASFTLR